MTTCATCYRWLTTVATMLTGQCERCHLIDHRDPRLHPYWLHVDPDRVPKKQKELFDE
jgi:hypothetical protein